MVTPLVSPGPSCFVVPLSTAAGDEIVPLQYKEFLWISSNVIMWHRVHYTTKQKSLTFDLLDIKKGQNYIIFPLDTSCLFGQSDRQPMAVTDAEA